MPTELIPILALAVMFIAATVLPVNMGALGFVAAFFVGTVAVGMDADQIIGGLGVAGAGGPAGDEGCATQAVREVLAGGGQGR